MARRSPTDDIGKTGYQADINTYYRLTSTAPSVWQPVPDPSSTSPPFELSTGAADAESYHDFFRLQIAFEDVWAELLDPTIGPTGKQAYALWDALMDQDPDSSHYKDSLKKFLPALKDDITGVDELKTFLDNLKIQLGITAPTPAPVSNIPQEITQLWDAVADTLRGCDMLLLEINRAAAGGIKDSNTWFNEKYGQSPPHTDDLVQFPDVARREVFVNILQRLGYLTPPSQPSAAPAPPEVTFTDLGKLLTELDSSLREKYRFDVFAPASINYGLLLNYRQHWQPQSYQVGNLVSTIPLAPQETRRYTTKTVVKRTRNMKEISDSLRSGKDESGDTGRVDAEIVDRAKNQTSFQANADGSYGNGNLYKISAGMQQRTDQAVESAQTKREFHESVVKSAQEYRNEHRLEISTEETREDETTSFREIRNPNDELTVTYLFYELQRRYLVDESLHKITPVVLVANDVPAPHEVDQGWILRYDWILKRTILDDSFLPCAGVSRRRLHRSGTGPADAGPGGRAAKTGRRADLPAGPGGQPVAGHCNDRFAGGGEPVGARPARCGNSRPDQIILRSAEYHPDGKGRRQLRPGQGRLRQGRAEPRAGQGQPAGQRPENRNYRPADRDRQVRRRRHQAFQHARRDRPAEDSRKRQYHLLHAGHLDLRARGPAILPALQPGRPGLRP